MDHVWILFERTVADLVRRGQTRREAERDAVALVAADLRNEPRLTDEYVSGGCAVCQQQARAGDPLLPVLSQHCGRFTWLDGETCWWDYRRRQEARVVRVLAGAFLAGTPPSQ